MAKTYEAVVMDDGRLALADDACHEMDLRNGDRVEVTIQRLPATGSLDADNPLMKLIGLCADVKKTDLAINHDDYLYRKDNP